MTVEQKPLEKNWGTIEFDRKSSAFKCKIRIDDELFRHSNLGENCGNMKLGEKSGNF